jgi:hypothetical protein
VDWDGEHDLLTFVREGEGALVSSAPPLIAQTAAAGEVRDGKSVDAPTEAVMETRKSRAALPTATPAAAPQGRKKHDR